MNVLCRFLMRWLSTETVPAAGTVRALWSAANERLIGLRGAWVEFAIETQPVAAAG